MPLTTQQRSSVQTFVTTTGASEKVAQRYLKNAGYRIDLALNHGIFSILSLKKAKKSRRKPGGRQKDATSSSGDDGPTLSDREEEDHHHHPRRKGEARTSASARGAKGIFGTAAVPAEAQDQQPAPRPDPGRVQVPPDRPDGGGSSGGSSMPWGKKSKKSAAGGTGKGAKKGSGYFETNGIAIPTSQSSAGIRRDDAKLDQMFDELRDPEIDTSKDEIGVESMMKYFAALGVDPETCEIFVVLEIVQATAFGQITRKGYVDGWKATGVSPSPAAHKKHVRDCTRALATDAAYFKKVYRAAFTSGKEADQKALSLENALVYWDMVFSPPGRPWRVAGATDWLAAWKAFLAERWTRSVNRDMWNQTLEFALRTLEEDDDGLAFWSEDAAWPGVIDEFVLWWRERKGGATAGMEVDS